MAAHFAEELAKIKRLRDAALETHKTAGDASAHVRGNSELQPEEEWRFRSALRNNADELIALAEQGVRADSLAAGLEAAIDVMNNYRSDNFNVIRQARAALTAFHTQRGVGYDELLDLPEMAEKVRDAWLWGDFRSTLKGHLLVGQVGLSLQKDQSESPLREALVAVRDGWNQGAFGSVPDQGVIMENLKVALLAEESVEI